MDVAKVLAQGNPQSNLLTDFYTVPANSKTVASTLKVCNRDDEPTSFRVSIAVEGATDDDRQYVYYDTPLDANDTFSATEGWTLNAGDVVRVQSQNGRCSFNLFGVEVV